MVHQTIDEGEERLGTRVLTALWGKDGQGPGLGQIWAAWLEASDFSVRGEVSWKCTPFYGASIRYPASQAWTLWPWALRLKTPTVESWIRPTNTRHQAEDADSILMFANFLKSQPRNSRASNFGRQRGG